MARVYLIRHASPRIEPGLPPARWRLSPYGIEESRRLAAAAADSRGIEALYSSVKAKATATAAIIALARGACGVVGLENRGAFLSNAAPPG
ncbi:MAG: histidine phosphatase family protein [Dehalococcoidia bacterium]|nr:histidine phosphatase family protein [Dehalococcoidia bacterium]